MTSPRGSAEHGGEHAASFAALAAQAVIGNRLRLPEARCEGGACGARFRDAMALGEGDLRTRAIAAGWREDLAGLLTCPACQQRSPWPDTFQRGRRAAHAPAPAQPAGYEPAAHAPAPAQPAGYEPAAHAPAPAQQPVNRRGAGRRRADPGQAAPPPVPAPPPAPAPQPPAGAGAVAWQPPAGGWPDPPPDGQVPARGEGFSEWEAWRAG